MVITTVKERPIVAILLLHSNVTSVDILICDWMEIATNVLVVAFTFALMARERRRSVRKLCRVNTFAFIKAAYMFDHR